MIDVDVAGLLGNTCWNLLNVAREKHPYEAIDNSLCLRTPSIVPVWMRPFSHMLSRLC